MIPDIYVHDGRLIRAIEDTARDTLSLEVELPENSESDTFVSRQLVFEGVHSYQVAEGPFEGCPVILEIRVVGKDRQWHRIRIDTNAGHREFYCTSGRVTN